MPNTNQILFVVIIAIIFTLTLLGAFIVLNKINHRRRELFDLEQRIQAQEQLHIQFLANHQPLDIYQPAMLKQGHQIQQAPIVIMTPQKKTNKRESLLSKVYGFRSTQSDMLPYSKPSSVRPPSFLPMKETYTNDPPAYTDEKHHS